MISQNRLHVCDFHCYVTTVQERFLLILHLIQIVGNTGESKQEEFSVPCDSTTHA